MALATTDTSLHHLLHAHFHGVPVVGIAILVLIGLSVLHALFRLAKSLLLIGVLAAAVIFFAPALLGKQGAADVQGSRQAFTSCTGPLGKASLSTLVHCSKQALTPQERAQAKQAIAKAKAKAKARAAAKAKAKAKARAHTKAHAKTAKKH